jgi:chemosensory pili system protein ChpC
MKKPAAGPRLHALEISLEGITLLMPSASVAEVINPMALTPVPFGPAWLKGVIGWRTLAVPVISFEALMGLPESGGSAASKLVIFYPQSGRSNGEFYALFATAEPRPQTLNHSEPAATESELRNLPFIAAGLKVDGRLMFIPDLEAIKKAFYPV